MWLVVQVHPPDGLFRYCPLNLCALMPLVEGSDGDDLRLHVQCRLQTSFVVSAIHSVASVVVVPGPYAGVDIARAYTWHKEQVVAITKGLEALPVLMRGAVGESVGSKICIHPVKSSSNDVMLVFLIHNEGDEDTIVWGSTQTVRACGG